MGSTGVAVGPGVGVWVKTVDIEISENAQSIPARRAQLNLNLLKNKNICNLTNGLTSARSFGTGSFGSPK